MLERLFKSGLVTTILGVAIIGVSIYMLTDDKTTQTEALAMSGLGLVFLRSKDSLIGIEKKG